MKNKKDPYDFEPFDDEERELIESIENAPDSYWQQSSEDLAARKKILSEGARNTMRKDERINIRITKQDLRSIKAQAGREGLPYQTLIASLITQYNSGMLVRRDLRD